MIQKLDDSTKDGLNEEKYGNVWRPFEHSLDVYRIKISNLNIFPMILVINFDHLFEMDGYMHKLCKLKIDYQRREQ